MVFCLVNLNTSPHAWYRDIDLSYMFTFLWFPFCSCDTCHDTKKLKREKILSFCTFRSHLGKFKEEIQASAQKSRTNASFQAAYPHACKLSLFLFHVKVFSIKNCTVILISTSSLPLFPSLPLPSISHLHPFLRRVRLPLDSHKV